MSSQAIRGAGDLIAKSIGLGLCHLNIIAIIPRGLVRTCVHLEAKTKGRQCWMVLHS